MPGAAVATGRRSEHALYAEALASYGTGETFPHHASAGFIELAARHAKLRKCRKYLRVVRLLGTDFRQQPLRVLAPSIAYEGGRNEQSCTGSFGLDVGGFPE